MNPFLRCFIAVVIVSENIVNIEAMGLCGFQRRFQDKIRKASDCTGNCKSFLGASTDPLCLGHMVNEPFVNENCTQRCVCNSTGKLTCSDYNCGDDSTCDIEDGVRDCYCNEGFTRLEQHCLRPTGCDDIYQEGIRKNGVYTVYPPGWSNMSMQVYCDVQGSWRSGGWTVFQRRVDGSVDFYRNWTEYKNGFGSLNHEFWLGNEVLYNLTNQTSYQLWIDLFSNEGTYYVLYDLFRIGNEISGYRLSDLGPVRKSKYSSPTAVSSSTGGHDSLEYHANAPFSTYDRDNDLNSNGSCAEDNHGGWWFTNCGRCHLNGVYGRSQSPGIYWDDFYGGHGNITRSEMKIRPVY